MYLGCPALVFQARRKSAGLFYKAECSVRFWSSAQIIELSGGANDSNSVLAVCVVLPVFPVCRIPVSCVDTIAYARSNSSQNTQTLLYVRVKHSVERLRPSTGNARRKDGGGTRPTAPEK